jgi:hypothetical protein
VPPCLKYGANFDSSYRDIATGLCVVVHRTQRQPGLFTFGISVFEGSGTLLAESQFPQLIALRTPGRVTKILPYLSGAALRIDLQTALVSITILLLHLRGPQKISFQNISNLQDLASHLLFMPCLGIPKTITWSSALHVYKDSLAYFSHEGFEVYKLTHRRTLELVHTFCELRSPFWNWRPPMYTLDSFASGRYIVLQQKLSLTLCYIDMVLLKVLASRTIQTESQHVISAVTPDGKHVLALHKNGVLNLEIIDMTTGTCLRRVTSAAPVQFGESIQLCGNSLSIQKENGITEVFYASKVPSRDESDPQTLVITSDAEPVAPRRDESTSSICKIT